MNKIELNDRIRRAFAEVPYPGDDNLVHPEGRDDGAFVVKRLLGKDWRDLEYEDFRCILLRFRKALSSHLSQRTGAAATGQVQALSS